MRGNEDFCSKPERFNRSKLSVKRERSRFQLNKDVFYVKFKPF